MSAPGLTGGPGTEKGAGADTQRSIKPSAPTPRNQVKRRSKGNKTVVGVSNRTGGSPRMNIAPGQSAGRRINPDSLKTLWVTVALVGLLGLTSFMVSFNGLFDVAAWVGLPWWMRWAVPIFIDIAILAYSMAAVIHRSRGEATWPTWLTLGVFTGVSVVANAAHALAKGEGVTQVQSWIGAGIAALAPLGVFAATEQLSRLAFATQHTSTEPEAPAPVGRAVQYQEALEPAEPTQKEVRGLPGGSDLHPSHSGLGSDADSTDSASVANSAEGSSSEPAQAVKPEDPAVEVGQEPPAQSSPNREEQSEPVPEAIEDAPQVTTSEAGPVEEDPDGFIAWVREQIAAGETITGSMAGGFLGKSDRTGRNRLNALREERPEIFEDEES